MADAYRAPMRSRHADVAEAAAVQRALEHRLCGFGGELDIAPTNLADAIDQARVQHDERLARRIGRFAEVTPGSLVWTRDEDGLFWLGRSAGGWRYDDSPAAARVDLVHVAPCEWLERPVAEPDVPAAVRHAFSRGGLNWQGIRLPRAGEDSLRAWERLAG